MARTSPSPVVRLLAILGLLSVFVLSGCFAGGSSGGKSSASAGSSSSVAADPVTVTDYKGDFDVAPDGMLTASETLTATFPAGRHGIFRFFDILTKADPSARLAPAITSVTVDGAPAEVSLSWEQDNRYLVAKIGDPNVLLAPGSHVYVISYTIPNAIFAASAGDSTFVSTQGQNSTPPQSVFYWNVVASGWQMPIQKARSTVHLPSPSGQVQCTAGAANAAKMGPCQITGAGTNTVAVSASGLPPASGMTVRAAMAPPPPQG